MGVAATIRRSVGRPRGRPFEPGRSGNPSGRPKGARNKMSLLVEQLLEGEAEEMVRRLIELATGGDYRALKACLDRLLPAPRDRVVAVDLPSVDTVADLPRASAALIGAVADGELTPFEGSRIMTLLEAHLRTLTAAQPASQGEPHRKASSSPKPAKPTLGVAKLPGLGLPLTPRQPPGSEQLRALEAHRKPEQRIQEEP